MKDWLTAQPARYWMLAILAGGVIHLAIWQISQPPQLFSDFNKAYWVAADHLWRGGLSAGYPFTVQGNWSNLPVIAWLFVPLAPLGMETAGWIYLAIGAMATLAAWALLVRLAGLKGPASALVLFLFLINGPLINGLREGNSTHFVMLSMISGLVLWQRGRDFLAGLAFGFCATVKLPLMLIGVYFLFRRRWPVVLGGATTIGLFVLASLALFGWSDHLLWYEQVIAANLGKAVAGFNAQSIDGFIIRFYTGAEELFYWGSIEPTPLHKGVRYAAFALLLGGFFWLSWRAEAAGLISRQSGPPRPHDLLQFCLVVLLALVISVISWTHYYMLMLLPLAIYLGGMLPLPDDRITRGLFWTGFLLASLPAYMPHMDFGETEEPFSQVAEIAARTIVSSWVFGAFLLIALFGRGMWLAVRRPGALRGAADQMHAA